MKYLKQLNVILFLLSSLVFAQKGEDRENKSKEELQLVLWEQLEGLEYDKDHQALKNTIGQQWGKSGAFSKQFLEAEKDGQLEFNIQDENIFFALGLSHENKDNHFNSMNHAFFFERGSFFIVDNGNVIGEFGQYRRGDHFKIKRMDHGNYIGYFHNNIQIYESENSNPDRIFADISVFSEYTLIDYIFVDLSWDVALEEAPDPIDVSEACLNEVNLNWIKTKTFDLNNNIISHSKVFADRTGKTIQAQTKNLTTGTNFVTEPIYDEFGRAVIQTLPAASGSGNLFCYVDNFVTNENNLKYDYTDFNLPNTSSSNNTGQINNPKRVQDDNNGTLGWYYSNNNNLESHVATTDYPYSRVEYSKANPGQVRRSSSPGNSLRMGKGRETESYSMPAATELYYLYGYLADWNTDDDFPDDFEPPLVINLSVFKFNIRIFTSAHGAP